MKHTFSYPILIFASWLSFFTSCATQNIYTYKPEIRVEKQSGIYVGAMSFANDVQNITGNKAVFLNEEGGLFLIRALVNRYRISNTQSNALSRAIEQAVSAINNQYGYFPSDVQSVNIVVITDKKFSENSPPMSAIGKNVNIYYFTIGEDIPSIASKLTEISSVVYFVLDAAPTEENNATMIQYSALSILNALSQSINPNVPTPMTKILLKEYESLGIDWDKTGDLWFTWGLVILITGGLVALVVLLAMYAGDSTNTDYTY